MADKEWLDDSESKPFRHDRFSEEVRWPVTVHEPGKEPEVIEPGRFVEDDDEG